MAAASIASTLRIPPGLQYSGESEFLGQPKKSDEFVAEVLRHPMIKIKDGNGKVVAQKSDRIYDRTKVKATIIEQSKLSMECPYFISWEYKYDGKWQMRHIYQNAPFEVRIQNDLFISVKWFANREVLKKEFAKQFEKFIATPALVELVLDYIPVFYKKREQIIHY